MAKFQPGRSGNPGGRPAGIRAYVRMKVGEDGKWAVDAILALAADKKISARTRLAAWIELLDRGFGKSVQTIETSRDMRPLAIFHVRTREEMVQALGQTDPEAGDDSDGE